MQVTWAKDSSSMEVKQNAEEIQHLKIVCRCLSIISTNKEDNLAKLGVVLDALMI